MALADVQTLTNRRTKFAVLAFESRVGRKAKAWPSDANTITAIDESRSRLLDVDPHTTQIMGDKILFKRSGAGPYT